MRPVGTTDPKYRRHDTEIWSFVQFLLQTGNFLQNLGLTAMDLERKFVFFFKTRKNSYMGPLEITDPEFGGHGQEIRSFCMFLLQSGDLR
jgi:hypothetical protein